MRQGTSEPDDAAGGTTALVLGVGGNVSQGILKALVMSELRPRIVAACVSETSAGLYSAETAYISPYADGANFPEWLMDVCRREEVDVVLSGSEPVLEALAQLAGGLAEKTGAVAIVSPPETLEIGADKLTTAQWLQEQGLPAAASAAADDAPAVDALARERGFPLIRKPRRGKGSQGISLIHDEDDLQRDRGAPGDMIQELLGRPDGEFTVGCLSDRDGRLRGAMVIRRELKHGTTSVAEAGDFPEVREAAVRVVTALAPIGPCNLQFRLRDNQPVCFEINVRFSGTTPIRARLGFNDVEAAVRHLALGEPAVDLPLVTEGTALRYWDEVYPEPGATRSLIDDGHAELGRGPRT